MRSKYTLSKYLISAALVLFTVQPWSTSVYGIPLQVILVWLSVGITLTFNKKLSITFSLFTLYQWLLLTAIILLMSYRIITDSDDYLRLYQLVTGIGLAFAVFAISDDVRTRLFLFKSITAAVVISTFVAYLQALGLAGWSWKGTLYLHSASKVPSGLEWFPVPYASSVIGIGAVLLASGLLSRKQRIHDALIGSKTTLFLLGSFVFLGVALAQSRSGSLGILIGIIAVVMLFRFIGVSVLGRAMIYALLGLVLVVIVISQTNLLDKIGHKAERAGADSRIITTWETFIPIIMQYPLGVPSQQLSDAKQRAVYRYTPHNEVDKAYRTNQGYDPHNWLLTTAVYYGVGTAICLLLFFLSQFSRGIRYLRLYRRRSLDADSVHVILCLGAISALLAHTWFHNANLIQGEMRGWFWLGLISGAIYWNKENSKKKIARN